MKIMDGESSPFIFRIIYQIMEQLMQSFDFDEEAVLFFRPNGKGRSYPLTIRRFNKVCEAILFATEELAPFVVRSCSIE